MRFRSNIFLAVMVATLLAAGCVTTDPAQPFSGSGRVWPEPPELARIEYVTEFSTPGDLGIKASFWNRMLGLAAGANAEGMTRPMAVAASKGVRFLSENLVTQAFRHVGASLTGSEAFFQTQIFCAEELHITRDHEDGRQ